MVLTGRAVREGMGGGGKRGGRGGWTHVPFCCLDLLRQSKGKNEEKTKKEVQRAGQPAGHQRVLHKQHKVELKMERNKKIKDRDRLLFPS